MYEFTVQTDKKWIREFFFANNSQFAKWDLAVFLHPLRESRTQATPMGGAWVQGKSREGDSQHHREYVTLHRWPPTQPPFVLWSAEVQASHPNRQGTSVQHECSNFTESSFVESFHQVSIQDDLPSSWSQCLVDLRSSSKWSLQRARGTSVAAFVMFRLWQWRRRQMYV